MGAELASREQVYLNDEIRLVDKGKLRVVLRRLRDNPLYGKPLSGPLLGCRSVRVEGSENRLVYEIGRDASGRDLVVVLVIGRRREDEVYRLAAERR